MAVLVQLLGIAAVCSIVLAGVTVPNVSVIKANAPKFFASNMRSPRLDLAMLTNTSQTATAPPDTSPTTTASMTTASTTKASTATAPKASTTITTAKASTATAPKASTTITTAKASTTTASTAKASTTKASTTKASTTTASTTKASTTTASTIMASTTTAPATKASTTSEPTTKASKTTASTTKASKTTASTTKASTTAEPATKASTTTASTTTASTTKASTTTASTTKASTTTASTIMAYTTTAPATKASTTSEPTTKASKTTASTTKASTTADPATKASTTADPATKASTTTASTTKASTTTASTTTASTATAPKASTTTTTAPTIKASTTTAPATKASTTTASTTSASTTKASTTTVPAIKVSTSTVSTNTPKSTVPTTEHSTITPTTITFSTTSMPKTYNSTTSGTKPSSSMVSFSPHVSYIRVIDHQMKLAAQFLKAAAQLSAGLNAADKAKFDKYGLTEVIHEILESLQSMGQHPASSAESWSLRGGNHRKHHQKRKVCTVTSGYWDKSCECEFIAVDDEKYQNRFDHPHWRPESVSDSYESDEWGDDYSKDSSRSTITQPTGTKGANTKPFWPQSRPSDIEYPRPDSWNKPRGEIMPTTSHTHPHTRDHKLQKMVWDLSRYLSELKDVLIDLERHHHSLAHMKKTQRRGLLNAPLMMIDRLQSILESEEFLAKRKSSDEQALKRFLESNLGEIEAMVIYPKYMINSLGKGGEEQPMAIKLQAIIDKLEFLER